MKKEDHTLMACGILECTKLNIADKHQWAFRKGNIAPDENYMTYLHGFIHGRKFHGHHYQNILPTVKKLCRSVQNDEFFSMHAFFRLGKLSHYVADSFTWPHNEQYPGNIREHVAYEAELHEHIVQHLQKRPGHIAVDRRFYYAQAQFLPTDPLQAGMVCANDLISYAQELPWFMDPLNSLYEYSRHISQYVQPFPGDGDGRFDLFTEIEHLHEAYLREAGDCETDCRYIIKACELVFYTAEQKLARPQRPVPARQVYSSGASLYF